MNSIKVMSKKINVVSPGVCHSSLLSLFKLWVKRKGAEKRNNRIIFPSGVYDDDYEEEMSILRAYYGIYDSDYDDDDEYYVDDEGSIIFPVKKEVVSSQEDEGSVIDALYSSGKRRGKHKHSKHRSRHKGRGAKVVSINTPYSGEEDDEYSDESNSRSLIYFYPDYHDKHDRIEFESLMEFDEYCNEEGFMVPAYVGEKLAYNPVSHCCLNPVAKEHGIWHMRLVMRMN